MTAAIPVQCSYQLSYQANWELVTLPVSNIPVDEDDVKWIYEISYILNCGTTSDFKQMKDHRSYALNLRSWENKAWKKIQAWTLIACLFRSSKYTKFHIFPSQLLRLRVYYELAKWPAPSWLDSSVFVRALHRYRSGHGFEYRLSLNLFQALFSQLLKLSA